MLSAALQYQETCWQICEDGSKHTGAVEGDVIDCGAEKGVRLRQLNDQWLIVKPKSGTGPTAQIPQNISQLGVSQTLLINRHQRALAGGPPSCRRKQGQGGHDRQPQQTCAAWLDVASDRTAHSIALQLIVESSALNLQHTTRRETYQDASANVSSSGV